MFVVVVALLIVLLPFDLANELINDVVNVDLSSILGFTQTFSFIVAFLRSFAPASYFFQVSSFPWVFLSSFALILSFTWIPSSFFLILFLGDFALRRGFWNASSVVGFLSDKVSNVVIVGIVPHFVQDALIYGIPFFYDHISCIDDFVELRVLELILV